MTAPQATPAGLVIFAWISTMFSNSDACLVGLGDGAAGCGSLREGRKSLLSSDYISKGPTL